MKIQPIYFFLYKKTFRKIHFSSGVLWDRWTLMTPSVMLEKNPFFWKSYRLNIQVLGLIFWLNIQENLDKNHKFTRTTYEPKICNPNLIVDDCFFYFIPSVLIFQNFNSMKIHLGICFMNCIVKVVI